MGVEAQDITPELAESFKLKAPNGALIAGVLRGGPADTAGVKPGDVLIEINGSKVADSSSMLNLIAALKPGDAATLKVVRNESELSMRIVAGKRPLPKQRTN